MKLEHKKYRLITEFKLLSLLEYQVGIWWMGEKRLRLKECHYELNEKSKNSNIKISSHKKNIGKNITIVEEQKATNISVIKNVFIQWEMQIKKINVDI